MISKLYETETAHIVRNAVSRRCAMNFHGHSYKWEIFIDGPIDELDGMIIDFGNLKFVREFIDQFDHSMVLWSKERDDIIDFFKDNVERLIIMKKNPTAENMARLVHRQLSIMINEKFGSEYCISKVYVNETRTGKAIAECSDCKDYISFVKVG